MESFAAIRRMQPGEPGLPQHAALPGWLTADLLPDWPDDWVVGWRGRWRMLRLQVLELLATAGRSSEAVCGRHPGGCCDHLAGLARFSGLRDGD